ncbi:MAG: cation transporter [Syntrophomonadaceae bacterium]|nr:cation transporter [Syntrophomonadaceae bacterium]
MDRLTTSFSNFMIRKTLKGVPAQGTIDNPVYRKQVAYLEAWFSIIGNFMLAIIKGVLGVMVNSISLIADAVHTASDVITSIVVIAGFKLAAIPPDEEHPHGHGRIEFIATLIISILLAAVGVKFGIDSYKRLIANTPVAGSYFVVVVMLLAGLFKELMSRFSIDLGQRISSSTLIADAWHHRTDAIASVLVAIAILASQFGYYWVDAILGFCVSGLIIWTAIEIFRESCSKIIGENDPYQVEEISQLALSIPGVMATHDISVHDYGANKMVVIHIEVDKNLTLLRAHDIADQVENSINEKLFTSNTTVHVDSCERENC